MGFRYIGAKNQIMPILLKKIDEIVGEDAHVTDLMCGTASVSALLRKKGYRVTANDIMTYAYMHAKVMLHFTFGPNFEKAHAFINEANIDKREFILPLSPYRKMIKALNDVRPVKGYFFQEFSKLGTPKNKSKPRNYFSPENAMKIDGIRSSLKELKEKNHISELEHILLTHDLIMAANDIANIAGTYGHYLSELMGRAKDNLELTPTKLILMDDEGKHTVYQDYAENIASKISCDLCYIDPPYMKRQYAANYHILETLARGDEPEPQGTSGLRPWRDQYSNFCTKTKIKDSFEKIFSEMRCSNFLISYNEEGLLSRKDLKKFLSKFGRVELTEFSNKRFKSRNDNAASAIAEYLFYLKID